MSDTEQSTMVETGELLNINIDKWKHRFFGVLWESVVWMLFSWLGMMYGFEGSPMYFDFLFGPMDDLASLQMYWICQIRPICWCTRGGVKNRLEGMHQPVVKALEGKENITCITTNSTKHHPLYTKHLSRVGSYILQCGVSFCIREAGLLEMLKTTKKTSWFEPVYRTNYVSWRLSEWILLITMYCSGMFLCSFTFCFYF